MAFHRDFYPTSPRTALSDIMELSRLTQAASALSAVLQSRGIRHAFYGSILPALLAKNSCTDEIFCIVESGPNHLHPFRRVRDAVAGLDDFSVTHSPLTNRLHVTYRRPIPAIDIEILPAGETGPKALDSTTVMQVQNVPFLTYSEFIRAKLKTWMIRGSEKDASDIVFVLSHFWDRVDINRIPELDMDTFAGRNSSVVPAWAALRKRYRR
ncbi:hypothetical protein D9611_007870 [Ephemerocybe angulata]|uniref:Uncharacterized protein n=2 Tax=Ephemerocybe angulata TaxID=980116 RepID=A0A8H5FKQ6_9AGAR|nr:hypothetical protein D9611_007870 [Tulosesus angulatus]KAF6757636.1 hypothetical protein DFP72DRAFT_220881 [Tulosesus angulatus]